MVDTEWPAAGSVDTILSQYGPLFERRRAEVAQRRVPRPLPLGVDVVEKVFDLADFLPEAKSGSINRRARAHLDKQAGGAHALRNSYTSSFGRWPEQAQCHCFEVLNNCREVELIASARKSS